jgi:hypothetical protein
VSFDLPETISTDTLPDIHKSIMQATANGELAVEDARDLSAMLETHRRLIETAQLEERIARLEQEQQK